MTTMEEQRTSGVIRIWEGTTIDVKDYERAVEKLHRLSESLHGLKPLPLQIATAIESYYSVPLWFGTLFGGFCNERGEASLSQETHRYKLLRDPEKRDLPPQVRWVQFTYTKTPAGFPGFMEVPLLSWNPARNTAVPLWLRIRFELSCVEILGVI